MVKIVFSKEAERQLDHFHPKEHKKIAIKISNLQRNPLSGKPLLGKLKGLRSARAWPYRIIYLFEKKKVYIVTILHRQGAYK